MTYMMRKLIKKYNKWLVNIEKTRYLWIGNENTKLDFENRQKISSCQEYVYLGVIFNDIDTDEKKIKNRIIKTKKK